MNSFKDLLEDQVRDLSPADPDPGGAAWQRASRLRRRRTTLAAGSLAGLAVAVVAVAGTTGAGPDAGPGPDPATHETAGASPSATAASTRPDARYRGTPVFWGPTPSQEASLPPLALGLPAEVDVATEDMATGPVDSAVAAFAVVGDVGIERFLVLDDAGALHEVDLGRIRMTAQTWPVSDGMLSPDGTRLAFPQADGVHVLTLATGSWRVIGPRRAQSATWETDGSLAVFADGARSLVAADGTALLGTLPPPPAFPHSDARGYGADVLGRSGRASAWWAPTDLEPAPGGAVPAQVLAVQGAEGRPTAYLVQSEDVPDGVRPKECCSPAFWSGDRVVYRSVGEVTRLLAWRPGTDELSLVSTIRGADPGVTSVVASFRQTGW